MSLWMWVFGVVVHGDYLVVDVTNQRVKLCNPACPDPVCSAVAGSSSGTGDTQLNRPTWIAVTPAGDYVVADSENDRVQLCPADGVQWWSCETVAGSGVEGSGAAQLNYPIGMAFNANDELLIADYGNHRVQLCPFNSGNTECTTVAGTGTAGSGAAQLNSPMSVVVDDAGDYVIADRYNHRIQRCPASSPQTDCATVAGTGSSGSSSTEFNLPSTVAINTNGDYVVADYSNHRVQRCPTMECVTVAGTTGVAGSASTELDSPIHVSLTASGDYLVTEYYGYRVQLCPADGGGDCTTVAGTGVHFRDDLQNAHCAIEIVSSTATTTTTCPTTTTSTTSTSTTTTSTTWTSTTSTSTTSTSTTTTSSTSTTTTNTSSTSTTTTNTSSTSTTTTNTSSTSTTTTNTSSTSTTTTTTSTASTSTTTTLTTTTSTSSESTSTTSTSPTSKRTSSTSSTWTNTGAMSTITPYTSSSPSTSSSTTNTGSSLSSIANASFTSTSTISMSSTLNNTGQKSTGGIDAPSSLTNMTNTELLLTNTSSTTRSMSHTNPDISHNSTNLGPASAAQLTTTTLESRGTEALANTMMAITGSHCEEGDFACNFGLAVLPATVLSTLCSCACCWLVLCCAFWCRKSRRRGQRYLVELGAWCNYRVETREDSAAPKTIVRWELDPEVLARFSSAAAQDLDEHDIREAGESPEHDVEAGQDGLPLFGDSTKSETSECSSSVVQRSTRLALRSGRDLSGDGFEEKPLTNLYAAYPHGSHVDYYSCTNQRWLRGVVALDALDLHVDECHRMEELVYGVRLYRTQQFRNHVPLHHLRWPLKAGLVVEVCNTSKTKWRPATIKKIMLDATDRVYLVELEGKEVVVSGSSIRRCLPEKSQVRVYRGPSVGWEPGVVQGEVEETLVKSTDSGEQFHHIVSRPLRGCETTDFDVVPDARMFAIALDEKTDIIPVHLLCSEDDVA